MSHHMRNSQTADLKRPDEFAGTCEKGDNCDLQSARREITVVAKDATKMAPAISHVAWTLVVVSDVS